MFVNPRGWQLHFQRHLRWFLETQAAFKDLRLPMRFELVNLPFEHFEFELPIPSAASRLGIGVERVDEAERSRPSRAHMVAWSSRRSHHWRSRAS